MPLIVNTLWSVNVYLNGNNLLGRAAELKVPQPKGLRTDYKGLGMAARVKVPTGLDVLESTIKWASFDPTTIAQLSVMQMAQISALGDLQTLSAAGDIAEQPVILNMVAMPQDPGPLDFKAQELVDFTTTLDVYHVDLSVGGTQIYLFDAFSNQYIVGGDDQLAVFRANQGD
jgi:uncharacterized protein